MEEVELLAAKSKSGKLLFVGDGINDAPVRPEPTWASRWAVWA